MHIIKNIIIGYLNLYRRKYSNLSKKRLQICNKCPLSSKNTSGVLMDQKSIISKIRGITMRFRKPYCTVCKCNLKAKTHVPYAVCPKGKWDATVTAEDILNGYTIN